MKYRRVFNSGKSYFFTVVTEKRQPLFNNEKAVQLFSDALRHVMTLHPFTQDAFVIMPDHIHCVWSFPDGDTDYSTRWTLLKPGLRNRRSHEVSVRNPGSRIIGSTACRMIGITKVIWSTSITTR